MSGALLYSVGTLATWLGWALLAVGIYTAFQLLFGANAEERNRLQRGLLLSFGSGAVLLLATLALPLNPGREIEGGAWRLPIVWPVMPFAAWMAVLSLTLVVVRLVQAWMALEDVEKWGRLKAAAAWLFAGLFFGFLFRYSGDPITILKGEIPFQPTTAIALGALAIAAMLGMVIAARATASRGLARRFVTHLALIAGSIIFGLPFLWLVITSFKEDRDMASQHGIVWVPKVQDTVPYWDKDDPLYAVDYNGRGVQGTVIGVNPDGTVEIDIYKPGSLRGISFEAAKASLKEIPRDAPVVTTQYKGQSIEGMVIEEMEDGRRKISVLTPSNLKGQEVVANPADVEPVRHVGPRWANYSEALEFLPPETDGGLVYLKNTLILVVFNVIGTLLSSSLVAYAFSRLRFPGRNLLFTILLSTMMLPGAVTLLPTFLIFRNLGWIDTLYPLWVPAFFGSAFNIFLLRQFFLGIPMELEDAAKIDGCSYIRTFWSVMLPQIKPALAVIAIWTFMGAWNNFMGPLIYISSPENMPISYALQLFQSDRGSTEAGLMMAFATMSIVPVLALFFFAQKYFIEGVTLSGLGGR